MTRSLAAATLALATVADLAATADAAEVRRLALVAGSNHGRPDRPTLRYAVADAERFASVMTALGGVAPEDLLLLREPGRPAFLDAVAALRDRAEEARRRGSRVEVVLYYSGHADEQGLTLGRDSVGYREVRDAIQGTAADVGIGVLDACDSGAITRLKGGRPRPAFLGDDSMRMQGHAFLTSSSENEAAQESETLKGSFFTHALVSGLRGAADTTGDGRVTLAEAYQFAFQETLAQTTATQGGAQHPAYDIRMTGTGDVVITDVRHASAALVLGPELSGRFFVRDGSQRLVAELWKPGGRRAEIAVEPGAYEVQYEEGSRLLAGRVAVSEGQRRGVRREELGATGRVATARRGPEAEGPPRGPFAGGGRLRVEILGGGLSSPEGPSVAVGALGSLGRDFALEAGVANRFVEDFRDEATGYRSWTDYSLSVWLGGRYYLPPVSRGIRPFARAAGGLVTEYRNAEWPDRGYGGSESGFLVELDLGADFRVGSRLSLTAMVGRHGYAGVPGWSTRVSAGVGFTLGRPLDR